MTFFFIIFSICSQRIEEQLNILNSPEANRILQKNGAEMSTGKTKLTDMQKLNLCLYRIESEYHFTGDGIWIVPTEKTIIHSTAARSTTK